MTANGRFVTFEGGEGAGKSTQIKLLSASLENSIEEIVVTREPGGSVGAEIIRTLLVEGDTARWSPLTEALLHYAARRDHLEKTVFPALERGAWVLCDRFSDSTTAYQGYGHALGRDVVERLHETVVGSFKPDLTIILDLPVEAGLARARGRDGNEDRYERMDIAFHHRLRDGFLDIARREPARCVVFDATQNIDALAQAIRNTVGDRLKVDFT